MVEGFEPAIFRLNRHDVDRSDVAIHIKLPGTVGITISIENRVASATN